MRTKYVFPRFRLTWNLATELRFVTTSWVVFQPPLGVRTWKSATAPANVSRAVIFAEKLFPETPRPRRGCTCTVSGLVFEVLVCATYVVSVIGVTFIAQLPTESVVTGGIGL